MTAVGGTPEPAGVELSGGGRSSPGRSTLLSAFPAEDGVSHPSGSGGKCLKSVEKVLSSAGPGNAPGVDLGCGKGPVDRSAAWVGLWRP